MSKILEVLSILAPPIAHVIKDKYGEKEPSKYDMIILLLGINIQNTKQIGQILGNHIKHEEGVMKDLIDYLRKIYDTR